MTIVENADRLSSSTNRVGWVDIAKGIGILLVVYGHILRGLDMAPQVAINSLFFFISDTLLYSFHMPLFFLLSGLFVVKSLSKGTVPFLQNKVMTIVYPYFLWSLIQSGFKMFFSGLTNSGRELEHLPRLFYAPVEQFWFLYILFFCHLIFLALYKINRMLPLVVGVVLVGCAYMLQKGMLFKFCDHFLFFALGAWLGQGKWLAQIRISFKTGVLLFLAFVGIGSLYLIYWPELHYYFDFLMAGLGMMLTIGVARYLAKTDTAVRRALELLGQLALPIYILHVMSASSVRIVLIYLLGIENVGVHLVLGLLGGILGPVLIVWIAAKIKLMNVLGFGSVPMAFQDKPTAVKA